jgi:hypothetical protein
MFFELLILPLCPRSNQIFRPKVEHVQFNLFLLTDSITRKEKAEVIYNNIGDRIRDTPLPRIEYNS